MRISKLFLVLSFFFTLSGEAQVTGLWKVLKIRRGNSEITPTAEWIKIQDNAKFYAGVGFLQNRTGIWSITGYELTLLADSEIPDSFPAYSVSYPNNLMKWEREEKGELVEYFFEKIQEVPMSNIDKAKGKWNLVSKFSGPIDRTEEALVNGPCYLEFMWDGHFSFNLPKSEYHQGRFWFDYHNSKVVLYSETNKNDSREFTLSFSGEYLILSSESEEWKFKRVL